MKYFEVIKNLIPLLEREEENMKKAGHIIAETIMNGGIVQTFGSGHSYATAIEIAGRAGGLLPVKAVYEETFGRYERIEGVGSEFAKYWDLHEKDCVIIVSNSGRNPFIVELAMYIRARNIPLIAVTALDVSKNTSSRHSSGKRLFELSDVVLDNHSTEGDAAVEIKGLNTKVGGTSSIAADLLLNQSVIFAIQEMLSKGFTPPILMSANINGGPEFNEKLMEQYKESYVYRILLKK
jgi:uncharacterized phosphosugar-binding protein